MLLKYAWAFLLICGLCCCEKAITFKLNQSPSQIVVDATIENGMPPQVILSTSLNYFSKISPAILESSFVHGALVSISDGNQTRQLTEFATRLGASGDSVYYYSIDTLSGGPFLGAFNTGYTLSITASGKQYTAHTTITSVAKKIDSLWWIKAPDNPDSSKVVLMARIVDPKGYGNYIRYFTSLNGGPFYPGLNSVFDDQITDGTTYSIEVEKGVDRNQTIDVKNYSFFNRGDSVMVKFSNIDKATYDFWRTMEYDYQSIGNPFSTPTQVLGNISGGGLGYFGGDASEYISLAIPK